METTLRYLVKCRMKLNEQTSRVTLMYFMSHQMDDRAYDEAERYTHTNTLSIK